MYRPKLEMDSIPTIPCAVASCSNVTVSPSHTPCGVTAEKMEEPRVDNSCLNEEPSTLTLCTSDEHTNSSGRHVSVNGSSSNKVEAGMYADSDTVYCDIDDHSILACHGDQSKPDQNVHTEKIFEKSETGYGRTNLNTDTLATFTSGSNQEDSNQTVPRPCSLLPGEINDAAENNDANKHSDADSSWLDYASVSNSDTVKDEVLKNLDNMEEEVEKLRMQALALEEKRTDLLGSLQVLQEARELFCLSQCDREEIEVNANRIICRCLTIDISVSIPRTANQEKALEKANRLLKTYKDKVEHSQSDDGVRLKVQAMLNACITNCDGPVDDKFQALVLDCTADDQKVIRKRLNDLFIKCCQ